MKLIHRIHSPFFTALFLNFLNVCAGISHGPDVLHNSDTFQRREFIQNPVRLIPVTQNFFPVHPTPEPENAVNKNDPDSLIRPALAIDMTMRPTENQTKQFIRVSNNGDLDEFVTITVLDSIGNTVQIAPNQFPLGRGTVAEVPLVLPSRFFATPNSQTVNARSSAMLSRDLSKPTTTTVETIPSTSEPKMITIQARGKRDSVQRSFIFGDQYDGGNYQHQPFCIDKDVSGTCRFRDDPIDCFKYEWTAYATILNNNYGHGGNKITSIPEGLFLDPGEHGRVRVHLTISCCTPFVQFISTDLHLNAGLSACVVDVRDLQNLHPGEIAGIVIGVVFLIAVIIIVIIIFARRRRRETINNVSVLSRLRGNHDNSRDKNKVFSART